MLSVNRLTKRFGGFTAVNEVSFELARGEILGLIGPNGSGKSTTFNVIAGLYAPSAGSVRFDGAEIGGLPPNEICRRGVARTFQIPRPFRKLSILENATLAAFYGASDRISRGEAEKRAVDALNLIGLPTEASARVDGLGAAGLKKLEMARALATQPRFILLDEPFAGIDPIAVIEIQRIINFLKSRGIGVLITDHNVRETLGICDHAYIISDGHVLAQGTPAEIVANADVRRVYLGEHFRM